MEMGYDVIPLSVGGGTILGVKGYASISEIPRPIDTLTVYVSPKNMVRFVEEIVRSDIRRVIFNPGTEFETIEERIRQSGKVVVRACTIVLLKTGQFDGS